MVVFDDLADRGADPGPRQERPPARPADRRPEPGPDVLPVRRRGGAVRRGQRAAQRRGPALRRLRACTGRARARTARTAWPSWRCSRPPQTVAARAPAGPHRRGPAARPASPIRVLAVRQRGAGRLDAGAAPHRCRPSRCSAPACRAPWVSTSTGDRPLPRPRRDVTEAVRDEVMREWRGVLDSRALRRRAGRCARSSAGSPRFCGTPHAVGIANGTDALHLTLRALGLGPGDEVVVPANTFVATAEAVVLAGARPRFADVDPDTLLLTPETLDGGDHAADPGGRRGAPLRADGRHGRRCGRGGAARAARRRGRRAGARRDVGRPARGLVRRRRAASASTRARTWGPSATPARSSPTTPRSPRRSARCATTAGSPAVTTSTACSAPTAGSTRVQAVVLDAKLRRLRGLERGAAHGWRPRTGALLDPEVARVVGELPGQPGRPPPDGGPGPRTGPGALACWPSRGSGTGIHYPTPCHLMAPYAAYADGPLPVAERGRQRGALAAPLPQPRAGGRGAGGGARQRGGRGEPGRMSAARTGGGARPPGVLGTARSTPTCGWRYAPDRRTGLRFSARRRAPGCAAAPCCTPAAGSAPACRPGTTS